MKKRATLLVSILLLAAVITGCAREPSVEEATKPKPVPESTAMGETETNDEKYYRFSAISDAEIENFAAEVRTAILNDDWESVAEKANFPLRVGDTTYDTAEDFLSQSWGDYFSDEWFRELEAETCHEMGQNGEGFMMASGEIWVFGFVNDDVGEYLRIWCING